ncbi:MAG: N-acylglucosamine 2-epimerase [Ruminococcaceae bacterium]|nr:N-acylglucosamine 2-epimerase [Oscillospiraceae bacterium]
MNIALLKEARDWARSELDISVKFWLKNGIDRVNGGVYTCLDREGKVYSTDKSVWMQGRCAWTFARLCNQYGNKPEWLEASKSCLDFLENHCINKEADGRLYFTVTADGKPLRQRRYYFSESFYIIANAEYYGATGEQVHIERARKYYDMLYALNNGLLKDPTGLGPKTITETRTGRALADPMIFLNTTAIMRMYDPANKEKYDKYSAECAEEIVKYFYKPELSCTLESVALDGTLQLDFTAGRVVNPGHDIECSWFLVEEAEYQANSALMESAKEIFECAANAGWDKTYGGLLSFIDCLGNPPEAYEHDMKLWWPHNELMIAALMFYKNTGEQKYLDWFQKSRQYCIEHFCDKEYGEWYGYLRRDGNPTEPASKGSTFKGPFHVPRCLMAIDKLVSEIEATL